MEKYDLHVFDGLSEISSDGLKNIVIDENTLCIFELDDCTLDVLNSYNYQGKEINSDLSKYTNNAIMASLELIEKLKELEIIETRKERYPVEKMNLHSIILNVAHDCQLSCKYCYGDGGTYSMPEECKIMTFEVASKALELLDVNSNKISMSFFGGEPLLNWNLIKEVVDYANIKFASHLNSKKLHFEITTNGYNMTEDIIKFFKNNNFRINLSLDGSKLIHNYLRPSKNGKNDSHQRVINSIELLKKFEYPASKIVFRPTLTRKNMDTEKLYDYFNHLYPGAQKNMQLVMAEGNADLELNKDDMENYITQCKNLIRNGFIKKNKQAFDLYFKIMRKKFKHYTCGMGVAAITVAPDGDAFPCYRLMGIPEFKIGNVLEGIDEDKSISFLNNYSINESPDCSKCWQRNVCTAGCYAENYFYNKDLYIPRKDKCWFSREIGEDIIKKIVLDDRSIIIKDIV